MSISIQKRIKFSKEQDLFLGYILHSITNFDDKLLWSEIAELYNEQFPFSKKTKRQLRIHYQNCGRRDLINGDFSKGEENLFNELKQEKKFSISRIAKVMNRTLSSVKNYYYRKYLKSNQIQVGPENIKDQSKIEIQIFPDDLDFFGIGPNDLFNKD
jgi:hypothetical protein